MCLGLNLFSFILLSTQWPLLTEEFDFSEKVYYLFDYFFCVNYTDIGPSQTISIVFFRISYTCHLFALGPERLS